MWRDILKSSLVGLVVLNTVSIGIKTFSPGNQINSQGTQKLNQNSVVFIVSIYISSDAYRIRIKSLRLHLLIYCALFNKSF